jgi:hypothetical protein
MFEPIQSIQELIDQWPKDDSGRRCADLVHRYFYHLQTRRGTDADCGPMTSQAEAAEQRTLARLVVDFEKLVIPRAPEGTTIVLKTLNRFQKPEPQPATK